MDVKKNDNLLNNEDRYRKRKKILMNSPLPISNATIDYLFELFLLKNVGLRVEILRKISDIFGNYFMNGNEHLLKDSHFSKLLKFFNDEKNEKVKQAIVNCAASCYDHRAVDIFTSGFHEENVDIRQKCIFSIISINDPKFLPEILNALENEILIKESITALSLVQISFGFYDVNNVYISLPAIKKSLNFIQEYGDKSCIPILRKVVDHKFINMNILFRIIYRGFINDIKIQAKSILIDLMKSNTTENYI